MGCEIKKTRQGREFESISGSPETLRNVERIICKTNAEYRIIPSKHGERHAGVGFMRVGSALSKVVEEGKQGIVGLEPPETLACRCNILKRLLFGFQVRLNVDLCCLRTLVAQP